MKYSVDVASVEYKPNPDDVEGLSVEFQGFNVSLSAEELLRLVAAYDPANVDSLTLDDCRPLMCAILDAYLDT